MSRKALPAAWGTEMFLRRHALAKGSVTFARGPCSSIATATVLVIVTAQKTCSQIHQSATIKAEQAVSSLSRTVELACWESCPQSLVLCKRRYEYTGPFPRSSEISHRAPRPLRSFYIKPICRKDLYIKKSLKNAQVICLSSLQTSLRHKQKSGLKGKI